MLVVLQTFCTCAKRWAHTLTPSARPGLARLRSQHPAGPARSFKKTSAPAPEDLDAPNVLHETIPNCRHEAKWATAGMLSGSPATITGPGAHNAFSQIVFDDVRFFSLFLVVPLSGPLSDLKSGPGSGARKGVECKDDDRAGEPTLG